MKTKPKVLYVDDEPINLEIFNINLNKNYEVFIAEDGEQALKILRNEDNIEIVVSDMNMPKMNGLEFIRKAREDYNKIPCFILTGYEITEEIQESIEEGEVIKYFKKPYDIMEIEEAIDGSLQSRTVF